MQAPARGYTALANALAATLPVGAVRLGDEVASVEQVPDGGVRVTVKAKDGGGGSTNGSGSGGGGSRGLNSAIFRLNLSAFCRIGVHSGIVQGFSRRYEGVVWNLRVCFVPETAQVELKSERV